MARRRKKKNTLSAAIVVLNLLIVGIIIIMCVLIYIHMTKETDNGRTERTTTISSSSSVGTTAPTQTTTTTTTTTVSMTKVSTTPPETVVIETEPVATLPDNSDSGDTTLQSPVDTDYFADDLFIGDSISTGLTGYGYLPTSNVFAQIGLNPESVLTKEVDGYTVSSKVAEKQPKRTYIMLGSNGIGFLDASYMVDKMKELLAVIEEACPTTQIVIISITPVTAAHEANSPENMTNINAYNEMLKQLASDGGYKFIDLCSQFKDESGYFSSAYAEADGLHFLGSAYVAMLNYIKSELG
ncbi:MAG: GDSL-type esterase/lipase family protein [Ruminiclostridium sp.]